MVPRQSLPRCWCRLLHRCVSIVWPPSLLISNSFSCSYDIFAINIASTMLGYVYGVGQKLNPSQDLGVKVATPVGTLVGQVVFGWLADVVGRKKMCEFFIEFNFSSARLMSILQMVLNSWSWSLLPSVKPSLGMLPLSRLLVSSSFGDLWWVSPWSPNFRCPKLL